jgi:hypothetical protein
MTVLPRQPTVWFAAALLLSSCLAACLTPRPALAQTMAPMPIPNEVPGDDRKQFPIAPNRVDNIKDMFTRLFSCWRPPPPSKANPENVTVIVTFDRTGHIFGQPKITYESDQANDNDRLLYRIAVMEALQRCTPMPFTEGMGGAIAGRIIAIPFHHQKPPPKPVEKRVWLTTTIL